MDSLLNYETVKYFGNERHIADRYDGSLSRGRAADRQRHAWRSLTGILQVSILGMGHDRDLILAAGVEVAGGAMTVGDFVLVNTYLLQLIRPLDRLGQLYRSIKQSLTDVEQMLTLLDQPPEVADAPMPAAAEGPGPVRFESVAFAYDPRRPVLRDVSFAVPPGQQAGDRRPDGRGEIHYRPTAVPLLRPDIGPRHDRRPGSARGHPGQPARRDRA